VKSQEIVFAPTRILGTWTAKNFRIVALLNPIDALRGQPASQFNPGVRVCVRPRRVIDRQRWILFGAITEARGRERNLSIGYAQISTAATKVSFLRCVIRLRCGNC
jgi:hypothetical protein